MIQLLFLLSTALAAQEALAPLPLAQVLDANGDLTPIFGLAGNFVPGKPGQVLLAYSNDGLIEWRLEPGRVSATREGRTTVFPVTANRAIFRGNVAILPESNETLHLVGDSLLPSSEEPNLQLAGRVIEWHDGKLQIFQPDGSRDAVDCPRQPDLMTAAAADWAHLTIAGQSHMLRLTPGRVELFVLPLRRRD